MESNARLVEHTHLKTTIHANKNTSSIVKNPPISSYQHLPKGSKGALNKSKEDVFFWFGTLT